MESKDQLYREHYEEWKASGESIKEYCSKVKIIPTTFSYWKKKFEIPESRHTFKELKIGSNLKEEIQIIKSNGTVINLPINTPSSLLQIIISC